ncbi:addiction module protein [Sulfurimonas sp.]|jgi:putative addiction module component (TIGR02574 family)|uniref:addiction module protein n=1 Tax=Sulfurimonas sp. TaxID=2022749 RepID=UPI0025CE2881|nr:addiction module protein [Sulfurimonas sp.]MBT5933824.1 addiction module protein [Sulfurimonas sp.]
MSNAQILQEALKLNPQERYIVVESLLKSLDIPDESVDTIWANEAEKRLNNYRDNKVQTIPFEDVFN